MDEVEIKNYGRGGVASEATLQLLLDATKARNSNATQAAREQKRLQTNYNKTQKEGDGILKSTYQTAKALGKEFALGGDRVSDFSQHILGANSKIQSLIEYADGAVDQFRNLSSVGAGFNNSIFDMISTAGTAGLRLDEFYRVVQDNSAVLRQLGGTVTNGAKEFADLSKNLRSTDLGRRLFDLGFTVADVNDGMIAYMNTQVLQGRLERMSQQELIKGSQEYLHEIDLLSKATGLSRQALIDQSADLNENAQFQSLMARAGADGASDLDRNLSAVAALVPGFTNDLLEMASGFKGTDLGIALNSAGAAGQQFADLLANADNMDQTEFLRQLSILGPQIADTVQAMDPAAIGRLRASGSPLAALFDAMGSFQRMGNIDPDAAAKAQANQDKFTSIFAGFSDSLARIKSEVFDAFLNSAFAERIQTLSESLGRFLTSLFGGETPGGTINGVTGNMVKGFNSITDALIGENGILTKITGSVANELDAFTAAINDPNVKPMDYFKERVGELGTQLKNWFTDMFFGKVVERDRDFGNDIRQGGIIQSIKDGFSNLFAEGGFATTISNKFIEILDSAKTMMLNWTGFDTAEGAPTLYDQVKTRMGFDTEEGADSLMTQLVTKIGEAFNRMDFSAFDPLVANLSYMFEGMVINLKKTLNESGLLGDLAIGDSDLAQQERDYKMRGLKEGRLSETEAASLIENLQQQLQTNFSSMQSQLNYGLTPVGEQVSTTQNIIDTLRSAGIEVSVPENLPVRRVGTLKATGKMTEPADTVAQIHKGERVLNPSEAGAVNDLPGAINQLNTLTAQIRDLMAQSVQHQEKTARGIRKLGSDMMA